MKVSSLAELLNKFDAALAATSNFPDGAFKDLRRLFAGHETENAGPFLDKLIKLRDQRGGGPCSGQILRVQTSLSQLEGVVRVVSAKSADEVGRLAKLLDGCSHVNLSALVDDAMIWLSEAAQPKPKNARRSTKSKVSPASSMPPSEYAVALSAAEADSAQFDTLVSRLRADSAIKKPGMREIARLYLGYELAKKKGREDALDEIVERQKVSARQSARGSLIDRLKPW